jgi:hypothetical protein
MAYILSIILRMLRTSNFFAMALFSLINKSTGFSEIKTIERGKKWPHCPHR